VKFFAANFHELYVLANVGAVVILVNESGIGKQACQIKRIAECGNVHQTSQPQQMYRQGGAQQPQNYGPPGFIVNLKFFEKFCH